MDNAIFLSTCINTYLFDLEFVYKACHHPDLIMEEVPVKLREAVCFSVFGFEIYLEGTFTEFIYEKQ